MALISTRRALLGNTGIPYRLRDEFGDTRAAGAVNGTPATPGPGNRVIGADVGNNISVGSGVLSVAGGTGTWGETIAAWDVAIARPAGDALGYRIEMDIVADNDATMWCGLATDTSPGDPSAADCEHALLFAADGNIDVIAGGAIVLADAMAYADGTTYRVRLTLYATGCVYAISTDGGLTYAELYDDYAETTATLYAAISNYDAVFTADNVCQLDYLYSDSVLRAITNWQATADRVPCGGLPLAAFGGTGAYSSPAGGRTFLLSARLRRIYQDGYIRRVVIDIFAKGTAQQLKFKVFRYNTGTTNYDMVSQSETINIVATGVTTFNLAQPMACVPGDILGYYCTGSAVDAEKVKVRDISLGDGGCCYAAGDITVSDAFADALANQLNLAAYTNAPYLAFSGGSIAEGYNSIESWRSLYWTVAPSGVGGDPTKEIANQLRALVGGGALLQYQNHAKGGSKFADIVVTGIPGALGALSRDVLVHCGINDVVAATAWATVSGHLDTIRAAVGTGQRLLIDEILPNTAGNDASAVVIRTWNASLATWCAANGAILVRCHDAMGQIRGSTGLLDDLLAAYDDDGTHLTQAGVDAMAVLWLPYL